MGLVGDRDGDMASEDFSSGPEFAGGFVPLTPSLAANVACPFEGASVLCSARMGGALGVWGCGEHKTATLALLKGVLH